MKIGILYICTGKYEFFWKDFYLSAERYFFQGSPWIREYYVFTDSSSIYGEEANEHIHRIEQANLGWPDNTMMRFHMFLRLKERLQEETDFLFFFNANMEFKAPVGKEVLPLNKEGLTGALHLWYYDLPRWKWPYERRPRSACYLPFNQGDHYYQGSLWGGTTYAVIRLCEGCSELIDTDRKNRLTPVWHDESALNRYFTNHPPEKVLDCSYNYEESRQYMPFDVKILLKNKMKYFSFQTLGRTSYQEASQMPLQWRLYVGINCLFDKLKRIFRSID